jgi:L-ascorbate metabolism protein UlaG (beta-lactamase superfamily)
MSGGNENRDIGCSADDVGHQPRPRRRPGDLDPEQIAALGRVDVLMVPVGGYYTIDAAAVQVARDLNACHPPHYKTAATVATCRRPVMTLKASRKVDADDEHRQHHHAEVATDAPVGGCLNYQ